MVYVASGNRMKLSSSVSGFDLCDLYLDFRSEYNWDRDPLLMSLRPCLRMKVLVLSTRYVCGELI